VRRVANRASPHYVFDAIQRRGATMSGFDDRQKGFEAKFQLDQDTLFKVTARRNKLLGLWAAEKLGLSGDAADAYAKEVVIADFETAGDSDVLAKVVKDFAGKSVALGEADIRKEMDRLAVVAREQIVNDSGKA
jgi:hypothetical protein